MQIVRVHIENFRGVRQANIELDGTVVFLGDNNTGKSTVLEAIELAIGADRLSRTVDLPVLLSPRKTTVPSSSMLACRTPRKFSM